MQQSRILVVDDSRTIRTLVRRILIEANYEVLLASDGLEAIQLVASQQPDLIVLDIQMPEMDGYTVCDEILTLANNANSLPIVFLTKERANHLSALGKELGAYLQKPICKPLLLQTIASLLAQRSLSQSC